MGLCLGLLALRTTYTEAAVAQTASIPGGLNDTVYSLALSGLLILAPVIWLLWGALRGRMTYRVTGIEIGLAVLLLAGIVSTAAATDKRLAVTQVAILLGPVLGAVAMVQALDSTARIRAVLLTLVALGIVSTYQCAEQFFISNDVMIEEYEKSPETFLEPFGIEPGTFQHFLFEHRLYSRGVRGFFTTSNSAASFALMASFAGLALLLGQRGKDSKTTSIARRLASSPYRVMGVGVVLAGLVLTQSKGGILGFLLAGVLFGAWMAMRRWLGSHRRGILFVSLAIGLVAVVLVGLAITSYGRKHGRLPGGNSMLVRWQYWQASAQMLAEAPLTGVGPGNFAHCYPQYKPAAAPESVADPHNFPLSLLTQYGPLGLIGFLLMVFVPLWQSAARPACQTASEASDTNASGKLAKGIMLAIVGALIVIRPILIPTSGSDGADLLLYEIVVLYIAPTGAFLIGFFLLMHQRHEVEGQEAVDGGLVTAALGCAVLGVLVHNLIDFAIFEPGVWMALWIVMACVIAVGRQCADVRERTWRAMGPAKLLVGTAALAIAALYGHYVLRPAYRTTVDIRQAQEAMATGRIDRAHDCFDAAFAADPLSTVALNLNGRLYLQEYERTALGQPALLEKAVACFTKATEVNPADYKNYEKAALAYSLMGMDEQAYDWYLKATDRYPGSGRIWLQLAEVTDRLGKIDPAIEYYRKAIDIEDAFQVQFRQMYPEREAVVSRLGQANYDLAKQRIEKLTR